VKTIFVLVLYGVVGTFARWIISFLADLASALGVLVGSLGRLKDLTGFRKGLVVVCCPLGRAYVFLAWVAFVVGYTTLITRHQPVVRWLAWIAAFYAAMVPGSAAAAKLIRAIKEDPKLGRTVLNITVRITCLLVVSGFFLFVFFPALMLYGWAWVPYVSAAAQP
jgi:hypothetical protein